MPESGDTLLTTAEAADRLGVSPRRVRQLVRSGELTGEKRGRDLFLRATDVAAYKRKPVGYPHGRPRRPPPATSPHETV